MFTVNYRDEKYVVKFEHKPFDVVRYDSRANNWVPAAGMTTCEITNEAGFTQGSGIAHLSYSDRYDGIEGEKKALARALKVLNYDRRDLGLRFTFWEAWFSTHKGKRTAKARKSFMAQIINPELSKFAGGQ
jgi:hypothetical protein